MPLEMFTIYDRPRDYPEEVVCRRWEVRDGRCVPLELIASGQTVDEVREKILRPGLVRWPWGDPDPSIAESWF